MASRREVTRDVRVPDALSDDRMLSCLGVGAADTFMRSLFWLQLFFGVRTTGMQMHKDGL